MRLVALLTSAVLWLLPVGASDLLGQQLEVRRLKDGLIQMRHDRGLKFVIQPDSKTQIPQALASDPVFALASQFDPTLIQTNGAGNDTLGLQAGSPIPPNAVLIESVLIGEKQAGIQVKLGKLNVLLASVDLMSEQSWITTHRDQDINLLVLTFKDSSKLDTARMNLWLSLVRTQQIALNPLNDLPVASMEKFYQSIAKKRVLPTAVLPMLQIPNRNLDFGDRQVVLLKELE